MTGSTRAPTRARLRTKTGCLTCRKRRKKCNEVHPSCGECSYAARKCEWPASQDLLDRRFASHHDSRHRPRSEKGTPSPKAKSVAIFKPVRRDQMAEHSSQAISGRQPYHHLASLGHLQAESGAAFIVISRDTSVVLSRHFVERYYDLLLLPACHHSFYDTWLTEIEVLMDSCKSLYYSALACSAAHIQLQSHTEADRGISPITYYTNATKELSGMIEHATRPEGDNGLLTSVILMYLHGCMGLGTYSDIPIHVNAAIRILTMRLLRNGGTIRHPFDRTAVESVLYQIFLVSTGLWSEPAGTVYAFNTDFWSQADDLLERSTFFPGKSVSFNSPVLGVPTSLFRLALTLRQQFGSGAPVDEDVMREAKGEVDDWEAALLADEFSVVERSPGGEEEDIAADEAQEICKDAERLYAIIVSLLYEQLTHRDVSESPPLPDSKAWQVKKALRILERRKDDTAWSRCYIGNWPVYTIGFFMDCLEEQEAVRHDMQRRWEEIGFAQIARFRNDLESVWAQRVSCQSV